MIPSYTSCKGSLLTEEQSSSCEGLEGITGKGSQDLGTETGNTRHKITSVKYFNIGNTLQENLMFPVCESSRMFVKCLQPINSSYINSMSTFVLFPFIYLFGYVHIYVYAVSHVCRCLWMCEHVEASVLILRKTTQLVFKRVAFSDPKLTYLGQTD